MYGTTSEHDEPNLSKEQLKIILDEWVKNTHSLDYQSFVGYKIEEE